MSNNFRNMIRSKTDEIGKEILNSQVARGSGVRQLYNLADEEIKIVEGNG